MDISKWSDLTVDRVVIALQVRNDKTSPLHSDRPNHGLIMNCRGIEPREYRFSPVTKDRPSDRKSTRLNSSHD